MAKKFIIQIPDNYWENKFPQFNELDFEQKNQFLKCKYEEMSRQIHKKNFRAIIIQNGITVKEVDLDKGDLIEFDSDQLNS